MLYACAPLKPEFTMSTYAFALTWMLSSVACLIIAKRRHVKNTAGRSMLAALLGPIAIPWVLIAAPEKLR
jgi:hypothetical protein